VRGCQSAVSTIRMSFSIWQRHEIICPYCSTLYRYAADLAAGQARRPNAW